ncbi:16S rRNA (cytidine(1402)-2'-O)-methyltransferase [Patescibacteria group bacterium]|nr:16S rRNA (cytidine(1402)-2'-O)-methyltransferase [Patescibacteria group bacterium]MBU1964133.1 16S rRNA (cytidine(1402)-2'-O)-methyltransferase [Patescibacteria group bacterium]
MGKLFIIGTPIGNLDDITFRAIETLKTVDLIACEDTRHTKILLEKYGIENDLLSYHQHSGQKKSDEIMAILNEGKSVALVSDAGTPGISDPGAPLIREAIENDIEVISVPGPSALITALAGAGVNTSKFVYLGYMPHKKGRQTLFKEIADEKRTVVFYESTHRIMKTLESLKEVGKKVVLGRELTKIHEEFLRGTPEELITILTNTPEKQKGEFVVIISDK